MIRWLVLLMLLAGPGAADPAFIDRSAALPVAQIYSGGWEHFVGGGVAILDCNDDGYPDMYAAGGAGPSRLFVNTTGRPGAPIRFALGGHVPALTGVTGAYPLDIDGDGRLDLFVMRVGGNVVLRGAPECRFSDVTAAWGVTPGDAWTTAFSATWEAGQDWPTLAVGNYVDLKNPDGPFEACDKNRLIRPEGHHYGAPLDLTPGFCALSMLISDWRRDGHPDLRIANDRQYYVNAGYEQMWHLGAVPHEYTAAEGWKKVKLWGMGIASRDLNGDGYPEVMTTSMGDQLMQLNHGGTLVNAPYSIGTYAQIPFEGDDGRPSTGWHAEFGDIDNDGRADLFIAKGNVDQMPTNAMKDPNNLLMQQPDGHFVEKAHQAGIDSTARSRGGGVIDLNRDGLLDIVVVNRRAPMEIWQNATRKTGAWLEVAPRLDHANTRAVGAWVSVRTAAGVQQQEVTVGGGHASGHAGPLHFGLGPAGSAEVRVRWPGGATSGWQTVAAGQRVTVRPDGTGLRIDRQ